MTVKRWNFQVDDLKLPQPFVLASDYDALAAELAECRADAERVVKDLVAFVALMYGRGLGCTLPETIELPLGIPVKVGEIVRDANAFLAAIDAARAAGSASPCSGCNGTGLNPGPYSCIFCNGTGSTVSGGDHE
jgi:hypothetical protein